MDITQGLAESGSITSRQNPNVVVLEHPSGSKVYLVATAHISQLSQKDVQDTIENVAPAIVVLEIDADRMQRLLSAAQFGDRFGLRRFQSTSTTKIIGMALSGDLLTYASGLFYVVSGAIMGTQPGGEFLAAEEAAERLGAKVIYADRSQHVTMRRLQWYTRKLMEAERGQGGGVGRPPTMDWPMQNRGGGGGGGVGGDSDEDDGISSRPTFTRPRTGFPTSDSSDQVSQHVLRAKAEVEAAINPEDNPWAITGDDDSSESAMKARLLRMMREGGCPQPNAVLEAAQRLMKAGLDPKGSISSKDILEVRTCGTTLIENFRTRALQGDDAWIKEFELESITGAKGALGSQRNGMAMRKVVLDERDWILARKLWEAGNEAGEGQSIVGVCGAGHVRGIQKYWNVAGSTDAAMRAEEYSRLPRGEGPPSFVGLAVTGGVMAWIAYRRPKAAALFGGAIALATAPYLGFSVFSMKKFTALADKLAKACERIESSGDMLGGGSGDGWAEDGSGSSDWQ